MGWWGWRAESRKKKEKYSQLCCRHKLSFHGWKLVLQLDVVVVVVVVVDFAFIQFLQAETTDPIPRSLLTPHDPGPATLRS